MLEKGTTLSAGDRQYRIISPLGRGANTAAYLAQCQQGDLVSRCILKEFSPQGTEDIPARRERFLVSAKLQNDIRQQSLLSNQTPPVCQIFEAGGTPYIAVSCFGGTTLDKLTDLTLPQYMALCETIARTVSCYHRSGFLCLDLKPENIFVLQNSPEETITQLVEFIDFDSVRDTRTYGTVPLSYTRDWAAPEQQDLYSASAVGTAADIFTLGELVFFLVFGRHSAGSEHRGFSRYPFEECREEWRQFTDRPEVRGLLVKLFRGTLRSSGANRFDNADEVAAILHELVQALEQRDFVVPILPAVSPDFVGREQELKALNDALEQSRALYLTGIGGIGKTTLVRAFMDRHRADYQVMVYLEFDGDFVHTFCDDMQLQLSTVTRQEGEKLSNYFPRKLNAFKRICAGKRVMFVLDNFTGTLTRDLSRVLDLGFDTLIVTRRRPPKNSFSHLELGPISDRAGLLRLIATDLGRGPTREERGCFEEIITLVQGHTLVLELIARQIAAGRLDIHRALGLIRERGFSRFSGEKVDSYKDGQEVCDTLSTIISGLFDAGTVTQAERLVLKILSLLNVRGLERELLHNFFPNIDPDTVTKLCNQGWLYADLRVRLHPVIAETVRGWDWPGDDVTAMELHRKAVDIYVGMSNTAQIRLILREAELFCTAHPRHIITAMLHDMNAFYCDTQLAGAYYPETDEEARLLEALIASARRSIEEMEQSSDERRALYLPLYYLSLAGVLIRSLPDYYGEAAALLDRCEGLITPGTADHCYLCMVRAWYFTLAEPDLGQTLVLTEQAEQIAIQVFPTALELIDIIHIPTANCLFYHGELDRAADKIETALELCRAQAGMLPYVEKQAELLYILLDIYQELGDTEKCRELVTELDQLDVKYADQGVSCKVPPELRKALGI